MRDPIEEISKHIGLCDRCGKRGYLEIGRLHCLRPEWWCEDCIHAIFTYTVGGGDSGGSGKNETDSDK